MKIVAKEIMRVKCNHCNTVQETHDLSEFKESNTYPPYAHFMCKACNQMAVLNASDMPKRLFNSLVTTIAKERNIMCDAEQFRRQKSIMEG